MSIEQLLLLSDDQIVSQYSISFNDGIPGWPGDTEEITFRQDQSFDPPQRVTGTYENWYQGQKIVKTNVVEETDKTFTIAFRCDQGWKIYDAFDAWFKRTYNEEDGTSAPDENIILNPEGSRTDMTVKFFGSNKTTNLDNPIKTFIYKGTKIKSIKPTELSHENGEPLRIECEFIYHKQTTE